MKQLRKQYHFRPSPKGLMAWDIHRLIELSKNLPVLDVALVDIQEIDEPFWFAHEDDVPTCRKISEHAKLIGEVDTNFPIILFSDGRVADGMHRVCRALIDGAQTIKAVRFSKDPEPDYVGVDPNGLPY